MSQRVPGKVALITGAARGQGRAFALRLAEEGADIIAVDVCAAVAEVPYPPATQEDLAHTAALVAATGRRVFTSTVDVRDLDSLKLAVADGVEVMGRLDVVIANAGIVSYAPWHRVTAEMFADTIGVNLTGVWNTVMAGAPFLVSGGGGSIILVSSVAGLKGLPFLVPYVASKHGVTGLARAFAHELAQHNIRVNSLHPAGVRTAMASGEAHSLFVEALGQNERLRGMHTNSLPVDMTEPEDQANAVLFLASDEARYITACALPVDAGNSQY